MPADPTKLNISIRESQRKKSEIGRLYTLDYLISWIRQQNFDEYTTAGLIAMASRYPAAALPSFRNNINLMIQRVRAQRLKDQEGETHAKEKPKKNPNNMCNLGEGSEKSATPTPGQTFAQGPQKVSITEDEIREEWADEQREIATEETKTESSEC